MARVLLLGLWLDVHRWRYMGHALNSGKHPYVSLGWAPGGEEEMGGRRTRGEEYL